MEAIRPTSEEGTRVANQSSSIPTRCGGTGDEREKRRRSWREYGFARGKENEEENLLWSFLIVFKYVKWVLSKAANADYQWSFLFIPIHSPFLIAPFLKMANNQYLSGRILRLPLLCVCKCSTMN